MRVEIERIVVCLEKKGERLERFGVLCCVLFYHLGFWVLLDWIFNFSKIFTVSFFKFFIFYLSYCY